MDEQFARRVEEAVGRAERDTDAEIVVVVAGRSEPYRDVAALAGAGAAWLALAFAIYSPVPLSGWWLPVELPVVGIVVGWLVHRSPAALRLLTRARRRRAAVEAAAARVFHEEAIVGTKRRTGVLVYASLLERRVVVIPDGGVDARVPRGEWNAIRWGGGRDPAELTDADAFLAGLEAAGRLLAERVPPVAGDNPDEIDNAPRFR